MQPLLGFAFGMPGPMELVIIAVIAVLLFGSRLPQVARSIGSAIPEFRKGLQGVSDEIKEEASAIENEAKNP